MLDAETFKLVDDMSQDELLDIFTYIEDRVFDTVTYTMEHLNEGDIYENNKGDGFVVVTALDLGNSCNNIFVKLLSVRQGVASVLTFDDWEQAYNYFKFVLVDGRMRKTGVCKKGSIEMNTLISYNLNTALKSIMESKQEETK